MCNRGGVGISLGLVDMRVGQELKLELISKHQSVVVDLTVQHFVLKLSSLNFVTHSGLDSIITLWYLIVYLRLNLE